MQYNAETPEAYLALLEDDWRRSRLLELRELLLGHGLEECIRYKMLAYRLGDEVIFQLNAQKNYVSLYVGEIAKVDPHKVILKVASHGKGCIRFGKSTVLEGSGGAEFVDRAVELARKGVYLGC
ncbi:MAG: DUF1801 domain-containing protein [Candidatus Eremiobacteraeota bacterium]|nr:DUF1801 domain-containing protein [Candidatus Eremiobacteraeota bacterium]MCW5866185.1 DUF1801 domain-containing protein [Candidatus Eremiobacteraeota bacterium]